MLRSEVRSRVRDDVAVVEKYELGAVFPVHGVTLPVPELLCSAPSIACSRYHELTAWSVPAIWGRGYCKSVFPSGAGSICLRLRGRKKVKKSW